MFSKKKLEPNIPKITELEVINFLDKILQGEIKHKDHGLCFNIEQEFDKEIEEIFDSFYMSYLATIDEWDKYSGNEMYPIPVPKTGKYQNVWNPEIAYHIAHAENEIWEGEYGKLRLEFVDFLRDYLKASLVKY